MAISVNWATRVIFVPRADLTLIQAVPTEIRELNLTSFHYWLKDAEDSDDGMAFPDTHRHNTEVSLGGIIYARVIEMTNGFSVTFEDAPYAVNLVGANSNVGDVVNVNQVSVRTANSAGLISNAAIEFSSFQGVVTVDVTSGYSGTLFPVGTRQAPVNNLADAQLIAATRGLSALFFLGDFTFPAATFLQGFTLRGEGMQRSTLTFEAGSVVLDCQVEDALIQGATTGISGFLRCHVGTFEGISPIPASQQLLIDSCLVHGPVKLPPLYSGSIIVLNSWGCVPGVGRPVFDFNGSPASLLVRRYAGDIEFRNCSQPVFVEMDINTGHVTLDSTVTAGAWTIRGVVTVDDYSTGTTVDLDGVASKQAVADAVQEEIGTEIQFGAFQGKVWLDVVGGTPGTAYPAGTPVQPVDNLADALTIAAARGFDTITLLSALTVTAGQNLDEMTLASANWLSVTVEPGASLVNTVFERVSLYGTMGGFWNVLIDCWAYDLTNFCGWLRGGSFERIVLAPYTVESAGQSFFDTVLPMYPNTPSVLAMNTDTVVSFTAATDVFQIEDLTDGCIVDFAILGGRIILASSCTGGEVIAAGIGTVENNSTGLVDIDTTALVSASGGGGGLTPQQTRDSLTLAPTLGIPEVGSIDYLLSNLTDLSTESNEVLLGRWKMSDNQMTLYKADGVTPLVIFNLLDDTGIPTLRRVFERVPV